MRTEGRSVPALHRVTAGSPNRFHLHARERRIEHLRRALQFAALVVQRRVLGPAAQLGGYARSGRAGRRCERVAAGPRARAPSAEPRAAARSRRRARGVCSPITSAEELRGLRLPTSPGSPRSIGAVHRCRAARWTTRAGCGSVSAQSRATASGTRGACASTKPRASPGEPAGEKDAEDAALAEPDSGMVET